MLPRLLPIFSALIGFFAAPFACAAEVGAGGTAQGGSAISMGAAPDLGASALQMVFGLLLVLGLLLGTLWVLKRISQPRGTGGLMRVVSGVAVGPRERVVILELGSSWLVLGVAPGQVTTLAEIPRQEVPTASATSTGKDFPAWLKQIIERRG